MKTLGKTIDNHGEYVDVYVCEFCGIMRSTSKQSIEEHEIKCYHEEEYLTGDL